MIIDDFAAFRGGAKTKRRRLGTRHPGPARNDREAVKLWRKNLYAIFRRQGSPSRWFRGGPETRFLPTAKAARLRHLAAGPPRQRLKRS
jgi:hypothetical protein